MQRDIVLNADTGHAHTVAFITPLPAYCLGTVRYAYSLAVGNYTRLIEPSHHLLYGAAGKIGNGSNQLIMYNGKDRREDPLKERLRTDIRKPYKCQKHY